MPEAPVVRSLYVHVPFCRKLCPYCDYAVTRLPAEQAHPPGTASPALATWLEAIRGEWTRIRGSDDCDVQPLETLYVGGGTPSALGAGVMAGLREVLGEPLLGVSGLEWTAEANPEDLTPELVEAWRASGVNRLSIGVQSFQEEALRWLGRLHASDESERGIETARAAGIENINIDLAFGLPDAVGHDWPADVARAIDLRPAHITLQEISVEEGTPLFDRVERGKEEMASESWSAEAYLLASRELRAAGYDHYEVSSFALPGRESRHGWTYLSGTPWIGLGNAAHSHLPPRRRWNLAGWGGYSTAARGGRLSEEATVAGAVAATVGGTEEVDAGQSRLEALWLALRTRKGVRREALGPGAADRLEEWIDRGFAQAGPERVRLTPEGWLRLDRLVLELEDTFPA